MDTFLQLMIIKAAYQEGGGRERELSPGWRGQGDLTEEGMWVGVDSKERWDRGQRRQKEGRDGDSGEGGTQLLGKAGSQGYS